MTTETPTAAVSHIQDASTARWLARALEPARARVLAEPGEEAIERIRARIFGDRSHKTRTLAA
jgi:hypothetical protein